MAMKLFDAHCHLQDSRILNKAPQLISTAFDTGIIRFAVNGVCEIKNFCRKIGIWLKKWIGLDKGSHGKKIDFVDQVEVFQQQLELAKELNRPVSVHCVRAYGDLLESMKSMGPFPAGVILHSYLGSAEMVPEFAKLGAYFSFSGFLMSMKVQKAKRVLKAVTSDRILLETDAPDAVPTSNTSSLFLVDGDKSVPEGINSKGENSSSNATVLSNDQTYASKDALSLPSLNHPANIHTVLSYVASLLDMTKEELAEMSYRNAVRIFSYEGSKVLEE
ncbi:deoxyribonuclease, putative [Ricinus communis]|uniref:Deoxyribonuclease, putative n=1 Tax=Ricinus communis TaxID=3988 RepID=B9SDE2_RICCO|nr:deoxyribonuclease, putative [Ricinus communis]